LPAAFDDYDLLAGLPEKRWPHPFAATAIASRSSSKHGQQVDTASADVPSLIRIASVLWL